MSRKVRFSKLDYSFIIRQRQKKILADITSAKSMVFSVEFGKWADGVAGNNSK